MNGARPGLAANYLNRNNNNGICQPVSSDEPGRRHLTFDQLDGWEEDDHGLALATFLRTADLIQGPRWRAVTNAASDLTFPPRQVFETHFRPVLIGGGQPARFTGYYEPVLNGSRVRTDRFGAPIYAPPPELTADVPWASRAEIERLDLMTGRGLEIAWLEDPVEAFFLQVQGSGRVRLADGGELRVGFAAGNGHPYRSIGRELLRQGRLRQEEVSAQAVKTWLRQHPDTAADVLRHNPSFVFFRALPETDPDLGPPGTMGRGVTAGRTLAVDPGFMTLGAPVWIETDGPCPMRRLMVAQDTGSAIKGPQRADVFVGTGSDAGEVAGSMIQSGRMVTFEPVGPGE